MRWTSSMALLALATGVTTITPVAYILIGLLLAPIFTVGFAWMDGTLPGVRGVASLVLERNPLLRAAVL